MNIAQLKSEVGKREEVAVCFHCREPIPGGTHIVAKISSFERAMCCEGCRAVAEIISGAGLDAYYQYRDEPALKPNTSQNDEWQSYDQTSIAAQYVRHDSSGHCSATVLLEGLRCAACAWLIDRVLRREPGLVDISVNTATGRARLVWSAHTNFACLLRLLSRLGYRPTPIDANNLQKFERDERRTMLKRLGVAGLGMMQVMMYVFPLYVYGDMDVQAKHYLQIVSMLLTTPVLFYAGWPFLENAARSLRMKAIGMDVPVAIALLLAYIASVYNTLLPQSTGSEVYFDSVSMFVFLLTLGRMVEMTVRHRSGSVADALTRVQPRIAHCVGTDAEGKQFIEDVSVYQLAIADEVLIKVGEAIPVDGVISKGCSKIDESLLTGESLPVLRSVKDAVMAGTINRDAPIQVKTTALGNATVLAMIVASLERAQADKPKLALAADRVARRFLQWVLLSVVLVGFAWLYFDPDKAFSAVLAMLVVTCPCALSLATPTVVAAASTVLARLGLLVTRADAIEQLANVEHFVFDKTGTLTMGRVAIANTKIYGERSVADCVAIAAALEQASDHPIARAFSGAANTLVADNLSVVTGAGVEGRVDGVTYRLGSPAFVAQLRDNITVINDDAAVVVLGSAKHELARFELIDTVREEAAAALKELQQMGIYCSVLSGDALGAVVSVADECGIKDYRARLTPAQKVDELQVKLRKHKLVAMVGDGINDAPVLSAASVSIAMGEGTALAQASADFVLISNSLRSLPKALVLARRAQLIIRQNLLWAVVYNLSALPLAALGLVPPWLAAAGMSLSSVLVVLNATRMLHVPGAKSTQLNEPLPSIDMMTQKSSMKIAA